MLYWKEANFEDVEKEYEFIVNTPADENGFTNSGFGCSFDEFINTINEFNPKSYQFAVKDHLKALGSTETGKASQLLANRIFDEFSH